MDNPNDKPEESAQLMHYRSVANTPPYDWEEEPRPTLRTLLAKNPAKFMSELNSLERAYSLHLANWEKGRVLRMQAQRKANARKKRLKEQPLDEGSLKVLDLVEKLLKEIGCSPDKEHVEGKSCSS